jgi:hypothetical protein
MVRRWISRFSSAWMAGPGDRPPLGGLRLDQADRRDAGSPCPWIPTTDQRYLGRPGISVRPLCRVWQVAIRRRAKLIARGDPARD